MKMVMWDCPYCGKETPLASCVVRIYDGTGDIGRDVEGFRFFHLVCPYCGEEDYLSYLTEVKE